MIHSPVFKICAKYEFFHIDESNGFGVHFNVFFYTKLGLFLNRLLQAITHMLTAFYGITSKKEKKADSMDLYVIHLKHEI